MMKISEILDFEKKRKERDERTITKQIRSICEDIFGDDRSIYIEEAVITQFPTITITIFNGLSDIDNGVVMTNVINIIFVKSTKKGNFKFSVFYWNNELICSNDKENLHKEISEVLIPENCHQRFNLTIPSLGPNNELTLFPVNKFSFTGLVGNDPHEIVFVDIGEKKGEISFLFHELYVDLLSLAFRHLILTYKDKM